MGVSVESLLNGAVLQLQHAPSRHWWCRQAMKFQTDTSMKAGGTSGHIFQGKGHSLYYQGMHEEEVLHFQ